MLTMLARPGDPEDEPDEYDLDEDDPPPHDGKEKIDDGDEKNFPMDDPDRNAA